MTPFVEKPARSRPFVPALILIIAVALGGGLFWYLSRSSGPAVRVPVLTPEAKAYTKNLKLGAVEMKATENTLDQTLVEITGKITNAGDRPVRHVVLNCVFYDPYGQVLAREFVSIVRSRDGTLNPGQIRKFRLPFDSLPETWNQTMPQLVIAEITFG